MSREFIFAFLVLVGQSLRSENIPQAKPSLLFSCPDKAFFGVSASTPKHDALPSVSISVSDPSGRTISPEGGENNLPGAAYGPVIDIPKMPQQSIALATEICGAEEGVYKITITESGKASYRLTASASTPNAETEALILRHIGRPGRVWRYRVSFG